MRAASLVLVATSLLLTASQVNAQPAATTQPIPDAASLNSASSLINAVYSDDLKAARTPEQKRVVAQKLLTAAADEKGADRYALLTRARDLAIEAGDVGDCDAALGGIEESFEADGLKARSDAFASIARVLRLPADLKKLDDYISECVFSALDTDRFDIAKADAALELSVAQRTNDAGLIAHAAANVSMVRETETARSDYQKAKTVLEKKPDDPDANMTVGKYLCFMKGDWKNGLTYLASGRDAALKSLARQETAGATEFADQIQLGDAWSNVAVKLNGTAKSTVIEHALRWYTEALPSTSGLQKARLEQLIAKAAADRAGLGAAANRGHAGWVVLFRSSDPSIWNSNTYKGHDAYSISLDKAPGGIQFLKLAAPNGGCLIISITNKELAQDQYIGNGQYGWNGKSELSNNAHHLGIFSKLLRPGRQNGDVDIAGDDGGMTGWGFGNHNGRDDTQGFGWAGKEIGPGIFEISVKTEPLTPEEMRYFVADTVARNVKN